MPLIWIGGFPRPAVQNSANWRGECDQAVKTGGASAGTDAEQRRIIHIELKIILK